MRTWARHVRDVRDHTVFENHLARILSPFWAVPAGDAPSAVVRALGDELRPSPGEAWSLKAARALRAGRNAFSGLSAHHRQTSPEDQSTTRPANGFPALAYRRPTKLSSVGGSYGQNAGGGSSS
jgi:hypothetical protein